MTSFKDNTLFSSITNFLSFDSAIKRLDILSTDISSVGTYEICLKGLITNQVTPTVFCFILNVTDIWP